MFNQKNSSTVRVTKFWAVLAAGLLLAQAPAFAAEYYYSANVPSYYYTANVPSTSEINGDIATQYFNASIHLTEYNNQLLLNHVAYDAWHQQNVYQALPVEFKFQGYNWAAELNSPIRAGITNTFRADGSYESVVRANVNFSYNTYGLTEMRPAIATCHILQSPNHQGGMQMVSLEIVDAAFPDHVLFSSGSNLTHHRASGVLTAFVPNLSNRVDVQNFAPGNANTVFYEAPMLNTMPTTLAMNY